MLCFGRVNEVTQTYIYVYEKVTKFPPHAHFRCRHSEPQSHTQIRYFSQSPCGTTLWYTRSIEICIPEDTVFIRTSHQPNVSEMLFPTLSGSLRLV